MQNCLNALVCQYVITVVGFSCIAFVHWWSGKTAAMDDEYPLVMNTCDPEDG